MSFIYSLISGLIFGLGLIISGMTNPAKVIGFLDITGLWDPSLAFVMLGAIPIAYFAFRRAENNKRTLLGKAIQLPNKQNIDAPLLIGAMIFGLGWGLAGYCPGPAITSVLNGQSAPVIFVVAMLGGMFLYKMVNQLVQKRSPS